MSFLTGIAEGIKEKRERKDTKYADALNDQYKQKQLTIEQQNAATAQARAEQEAAAAKQAQIAKDAEMRSQGIDPATGVYKPLPADKTDSQVFPNNGGHIPAANTPDFWNGQAAHAAARAQQLRAAGRNEEADDQDKNAREYAQNATSAANSTYTAGAKTQATQSGIALTLARVHDLAVEKPVEFQAKMREAYASIAGRQEVASANAQERETIARLYVAQRMAGKDQDTATHLAIAQFQADAADARTNANNANADGRAAAAAGTGTGGFTGVQPPQVNVYTSGQSNSNGFDYRQILQSLMQNGGKGGATGGVTPPNVGNKPAAPPAPKPVDALVGTIEAAPSMAANDVVASIQAGMKQGHIAQSQIPAIIAGMKAKNDPRAAAVAQALSGGARAVAPPPVRGGAPGGGPFATPFSLQPQ